MQKITSVYPPRPHPLPLPKGEGSFPPLLRRGGRGVRFLDVIFSTLLTPKLYFSCFFACFVVYTERSSKYACNPSFQWRSCWPVSCVNFSRRNTENAGRGAGRFNSADEIGRTVTPVFPANCTMVSANSCQVHCPLFVTCTTPEALLRINACNARATSCV